MGVKVNALLCQASDENRKKDPDGHKGMKIFMWSSGSQNSGRVRIPSKAY